MGVQAEGLLLSLTGTALGVIVGMLGGRPIRVVMPEGVPRLTAVGVNYRILGSAALAAIACGLFIGLGPATYLTTPNLAGARWG